MSGRCGVCQREVAWTFAWTRYVPTIGHWEPVQACQACLPPSDETDDAVIRRARGMDGAALRANRAKAAQRAAALRAQREASAAIFVAGISVVADEPLVEDVEPDEFLRQPGGDDVPEAVIAHPRAELEGGAVSPTEP